MEELLILDSVLKICQESFNKRILAAVGARKFDDAYRDFTMLEGMQVLRSEFYQKVKNKADD